MERALRTCVALVVGCLLAFKALAQPVDAPPPAGVTAAGRVEGVSEYRLANGLRIVLAPMPGSLRTHVHLVYGIGSRDDVPGRTGYAHLLEHMLFKGTPSVSDVMSTLHSHGIFGNARTYDDRTDYISVLDNKPSSFDWLMDFEAERMTKATFTEKDLQTEMTVVRNEFEIERGQAGSLLREAVRAAAYAFHPYGRPIIGQRDDIEHVDFAQLRALYRAMYRPDNAVLVIAGSIDVPQTLSRIATAFGKLPAAEAPPPRSFVEPAQRGEREVQLYLPGSRPLLRLAYHVPAGRDADTPALLLLSQPFSKILSIIKVLCPYVNVTRL